MKHVSSCNKRCTKVLTYTTLSIPYFLAFYIFGITSAAYDTKYILSLYDIMKKIYIFAKVRIHAQAHSSFYLP